MNEEKINEEKVNKGNPLFIGTFLNYVAVGLQILTTIFITSYLLRQIGDNDYGIYKIMASFASYLGILNFGFGNALIRYLPQYKVNNELKKEKEIVTFSTILNHIAIVIALIIGIVIYIMIPGIFSESMSASDINLSRQIFIILMISVFFNIANDIYSSYVFANQKFVYLKSMEVIKQILRLAFIIILISFIQNVLVVAVIDMMIAMGIFLVNYIYCRHKLKHKYYPIHLNKEQFRKNTFFINYSVLFFLNLLIEQLIWNTDSIIIGMRLSTFDVTIFSSGSVVSAAYYSMVQTIASMMFPQVVERLSANNIPETRTKVMIDISRIQAMLAFYIIGGYIIIGKQFVCNVWLGPDYALAWKSSLVVMVGTLFSSLISSGHLILRFMDKQVFYLGSCLGIFLLNVVCSYIFVKPYGIMAAAYCTTAAYIVGMTGIILPYMKRVIDFDIFNFIKNLIQVCIKVGILIGVMYIIVTYLKIENLPGIIIIGIVYSILYAFVIYLLILKSEEKNFIKRILFGRRKR